MKQPELSKDSKNELEDLKELLTSFHIPFRLVGTTVEISKIIMRFDNQNKYVGFTEQEE